MKSKRALGSFLTLFGASCWGISGCVGQYLFDVQGMDSRWLVPIRLGCAGILLLAWYLIRRGRAVLDPWRTPRNARDLVIYGLLGVSACQFLYFTTIQYSSAGVATILQDVSPVIILAIVCLQQKRRPAVRELLSVLMAIGGVFLLTTHGSLTELVISPTALFTGLLSAVAVVVYTMWPRELQRQYPTPMLQGWAFLMGGAAFSLVFRPWEFHYVPNAMGLLGIAVVVLVGNVLAFSCYMSGVRLIGPQRSSLYSFAEPFVAALISITLLGTPFTWWDAAGFACIFVMLVLLSADGGNKKNEEPEA